MYEAYLYIMHANQHVLADVLVDTHTIPLVRAILMTHSQANECDHGLVNQKGLEEIWIK